MASLASVGPALGASKAARVPAAITMTRPPAGFENLLRPQETMVDLFYGGRRRGQVMARFEPGKLQFQDVAAVVRLIPDIADAGAVAATLRGKLDTHAALVCSTGHDSGCGRLAPPVAGIIFDEERFQVELFLNPKVLVNRPAAETRYLPAPTAGPSLVDSFGAAVGGSSDSSPLYSFQNRAILGDQEARLRTDVSYSSGVGFLVDSFVGEVDEPGIRYSGGLFWAPGIDLTGQRKILGLGVGTQFDTRVDRDQVFGNQLIVFLAQRSRVDILRDGRLLTSRSYEAGNQVLDTAGLPDGSYEVVLHIQEIGGRVREERRFFINNARIPPPGDPVYFGYAGVLVDDRAAGGLLPSTTPFFEFGAARRLSDEIAVDATILGTSQKVLAEVGGYLITDFGQFRLAGLVSSDADFGALLQASSLDGSTIGYSLDLRRVWSRSGGPLLPLNDDDTGQHSFNGSSLNAAQLSSGSFTQASASLSYRIGDAQLGLLGTFRQGDHEGTHYSVGPTLYWPVWQENGLQVTLQGNASQSNDGTFAFLGVRIQLFRPQYSVIAAAGAETIPGSGDEGRRTGPVGALSGTWQQSDVLGGDLDLTAGIERNLDFDLASFQAQARGPYGSLYANVAQQIDGENPGTQYSVNLLTGSVVNRESAALGGRDLGQSAIVVRLDGDVPDASFEVLVDEAPKGQVQAGGSLPVFVTPYRRYEVRVRPTGGALVRFDNVAQTVTLYPGTVATVAWDVESVIAVFGRALRPDRTPLIDADIEAARGIGRTDDQGYFQMEVGAGEVLTLRPRDGRPCRLHLGAMKAKDGYAAVGNVICQ
jgi:Mat/Ecp fimbriae outer membrane usher protein